MKQIDLANQNFNETMLLVDNKTEKQVFCQVRERVDWRTYDRVYRQVYRQLFEKAIEVEVCDSFVYAATF